MDYPCTRSSMKEERGRIESSTQEWAKALCVPRHKRRTGGYRWTWGPKWLVRLAPKPLVQKDVHPTSGGRSPASPWFWCCGLPQLPTPIHESLEVQDSAPYPNEPLTERNSPSPESKEDDTIAQSYNIPSAEEAVLPSLRRSGRTNLGVPPVRYEASNLCIGRDRVVISKDWLDLGLRIAQAKDYFRRAHVK